MNVETCRVVRLYVITKNMKRLFCIIICGLLVMSSFAQTTYNLPITGTNTITEEERTDKYGQIYNITQPRLDVYLPSSPQGGSEGGYLLLAFPGGAYEYVSADNEGHRVAQWMNAQGIAVAVLKYRQPNGHSDIPLTDARAALRFVREHAEEWGITQIGVIGFSAGGHLAASLLCYPEEKTVEHEAVSPHGGTEGGLDFGILVYPVLSMEDGVTHAKTKRLLLGENPTEEKVAHWTLKNAVNESVPRTLIIACQDDRAVPIRNSLEFYQALTDKKIPTEMLIFPKGGHGWGFTRSFPMRDVMENALMRWIRQ